MARDELLETIADAARDSLQGIYLKSIARDLQNQLSKQGYEVSGDLALRACRSMVENIDQAEQALMSVFEAELPPDCDVTLDISQEVLANASMQVKAVLPELPKIIETVLERYKSRFAKDLLQKWPLQDRLLNHEMQSFKFRIDLRWGTALSLLRLLLLCCREIGEEFELNRKKNKGKKRINFEAAILPIHVRSCQVFEEIICLLEAGFAEGALARWRTLNELSVIARLLEDGPDELSERFLAYKAVDLKKEMDADLSAHPHPLRQSEKAQVNWISAEYQKVIAKYGEEFKNQYGWASAYLGSKRPTFDELQRKFGSGSIHPYYKEACYTVHASAPSSYFRLSSPYHDMLVAGASNYGLDMAGIAAGYSITQITGALVGKIKKMEDVVYVGALPIIRNKAESAFIAAAKLVKHQEFDS